MERTGEREEIVFERQGRGRIGRARLLSPAGRRRMARGLLFALFGAGLLAYLMPLLVTMTNSFMGSREVELRYTEWAERGDYVQMTLIPWKVSLSQYGRLFFGSPVYLDMFWNSVKLAVPVVAGQAAVSALGAYAFTVLRFKGKEVLYFFYILVMLLPLQVTLMPNYLVAEYLHITESPLAVILPGIFSPFGVFLLRQFLKSLPESCLEAARMDGAGHVQIFLRIVLPLAKPALAALVMLTLLDYWNLVDQAVIFLREERQKPLSVFLAKIAQGEAGVVFAGSCFYALPVLLVLFYGQEPLMQGIAMTGVKD